ncbi:MAG: head GIN domain-containing protein [Anaerolineales bacterium]|jgi:D-hexose-6-phosphate mutarotase
MLKKLLMLIGVFTLMTTACTISVRYEEGSGVVVEEARSVSGFDRVSFEGVGKLVVTQGSEESLTIEAEDNILPRIETRVRGRTLEIRFDTDRWENIIRPTRPIRFYLTVTDLESIFLSGLGDIEVQDIESESMDVTLSGAGSITLSGSVERQDVNVSGAGAYDAGDLESEIADINLSGAGSATVWVTESLDVNITGLGSVRYYGDPELEQSISGLGSIEAMGER